MKKIIGLLLILLITAISTKAQQVGLSFSYFIPRNGYFSTPISPFSIRGVGVDLNKYIALETGASLYRMSGLNIINVPFESKEPMTGPNFTIFVPGELVFQFKGKKTEFDIKGGGFAFYSFAQKLNYGNIDRAIREKENLQIANADLNFKNKLGYGFHAGFELTFAVTRQWGLSFETNYLMGASKIPLKGHFIGADGNGTVSITQIDEPNAKVDLTGLEFSIGILLYGR
jgi:hypothetical protein